jgi:hypothetical protein
LKEKYYGRYCDDFVILSDDRKNLESLIITMQSFLFKTLHLQLHPRKITLKKISQGLDFLGYIILPYRIYIRTTTKKRMIRKIKEKQKEETLQSYLGVLSHAKTYRLKQFVKRLILR